MNETMEQTAVAPDVTVVAAVGPEQIKRFMRILQKYKAGRAPTETRIVASENWWKLRNETEERKTTNHGADGGFKSVSGWLHNVIVSKHADAMESYPEPNILPREKGDREEAQMLSHIIPCILEQNHFEKTYSDVMWQKMKTGTGVYKIAWDKSKLNGLGDILVEKVNLLNIYWEPGVTDIQKSRYVFHTEMYEKEELEATYPQLKDKLKGKAFMSTKFLYDDHVDTENKCTVVDVYYKRRIGGKTVLHYCKFVGDQVLHATENTQEAQKGLYDHGKYPYVFDPLFPIEGSPCGYGYVDICRNPQTEIDLLKTSFIKNAMVGAAPRYFSQGDGSINEEEFLDLSKPIVHVTGGVDENSLRRVEHTGLDGMYVNVLDRTIQELRETSGNTETSTGNIQSGVTAASAIAALQEASGKGSRDSTQASYRAYSQIVDMCIELIRQFYTLPRKFRIVGQYGVQQFETYTNAGIRPQPQGDAFGIEGGFRLPVFDIKVSAQKKNVYTKVSQNELSLQLFKMGFFNPQTADQAVMCLEMMDFEGKDEVLQKVAQNGMLHKKLIQYMQMCLGMAQMLQPEMVPTIANDLMQVMGTVGASAGGGMPQLVQSDNIAGIGRNEPAVVKNARQRTGNAAQPRSGAVTAGKEKTA